MRFFAITVLSILLFCGSEVLAQSDTPRFEVGGHFTSLRLKEFDFLEPRSIHGLGARFTFNVMDSLALEAEGNYFPEYGAIGGRQTSQGLFGVKAGMRKKRVGVFGKARPGFLRFRDRLYCGIPEGCPSLSGQQFITRTEFALDLGGVLEFYPARRVSVRVDVGDTIVRFDRGALFLPSPRNLHYTSHNIQFTTGVSFRFGG